MTRREHIVSVLRLQEEIEEPVIMNALAAMVLDEVRSDQSGVCRMCGCTDLDCSDCVQRTGEPCYWVEPDLCSACATGR